MKQRLPNISIVLLGLCVLLLSSQSYAQRLTDWPSPTLLRNFEDEGFPVRFTHLADWKMATSTVPDGRLSLDTEYNGHFVYTARYVAATKGITPLEYVEELEANRELLLREVQRRDSSARLLDNGRTSIDGRPAFFQKVSGTQTRGTVITVYQLYFLLDANIYLFQMSSPTKVFPTAFEDFSRIIRTVEFRK